MNKASVSVCIGVAVCGLTATVGAQGQQLKAADPIKAERSAAAQEGRRRCRRAGTYKPARTPWGDPAIAGAYNNSDESGIPFERPAGVRGPHARQTSRPPELAKIVAAAAGADRSSATRRSANFPGATSPMHWFENYFAANSRAWLVSDPPDGKVPPHDRRSAAACGRARTRRAGAAARPTRAEDRSLYDRCITRGIPGSMMPAIYGNSYQIDQGPGVVAITYEMVHETRVIPLDGAAARRLEDPPVPGRRARPLGRQHARRRDDQLHRQDAVSRLERAPEADRALHAARARHARVVGDVRRSAHLGAAVDVRDEPDARRVAAAVRVRVPRRQLRAAQHPLRGARRRGEAAGRRAQEARRKARPSEERAKVGRELSGRPGPRRRSGISAVRRSDTRACSSPDARSCAARLPCSSWRGRGCRCRAPWSGTPRTRRASAFAAGTRSIRHVR